MSLSAPEARTRDVWVISDGELPPHRSLWQPTIDTARVQRSQRVIQSRVADDLFWLGRYGERTNWIMRVLRSALQRLQEDNAPSDGQGAARTCLKALICRRRVGSGACRGGQPRRHRADGAASDLVEERPPHARPHARQALPRREPDARPAVARGLARAQPLPPRRGLAQGAS